MPVAQPNSNDVRAASACERDFEELQPLKIASHLVGARQRYAHLPPTRWAEYSRGAVERDDGRGLGCEFLREITPRLIAGPDERGGAKVCVLHERTVPSPQRCARSRARLVGVGENRAFRIQPDSSSWS